MFFFFSPFYLLFHFPSCKDKSPSLICEDEAKSNITTRFYDIEVSATDPTGNVGQKTCSVAVIPDKHFRSKGGGSRSNNYNKSSSHAAGHSSSYPFSTSPSDGTSSKGKGKGKGAPHSRNDLRAEYSRSRQRFEIETFEHEWDPRKNTTLVVPPLPLVGKGKGKGKGGSTTSVTSTTPTQQVESPSIMPQITTTQNQMVNSGTTSFSAYPSRSPLPEEGVPPVTSTTPTVSPSKNKANKKPILWIPNN